jgi:hypothetical protein
MPRTKKVHPADAADAAVIAQAVRFEIGLFLGTGRFATDTAATLIEARAKAAALLAQYPTSRRPLIYGIAADGRRALATETMKESAMNTTQTETTAPVKKPAKAPAKKAAAKKAPAKKAAAKKAGPAKTRDGSKTEKVLAMLKKGATRSAIVEATGWNVDLKQLAARKGLKLKKDAEGIITAA